MLLDMQNTVQKTNLREAILLHKDVNRQLADYCQAAAHVLRMAQPKVIADSDTFPDNVSVQYDYQTLRLLAVIRSNARSLLHERKQCETAFEASDEDCVFAQAQLSEFMEAHKPNS